MAAASLHAASDYSSAYHFTTLAGTSSIGSNDGTGETARFYSPYDVTTDSVGNLFVVDEGNHTIRKITPTGNVTTFAGSPGNPGSADGTGSEAQFDSPQYIVADSSDNLFVTDTGNHTIRKITPTGIVTTFAGLANITGGTDGNGNAARFNLPRGIDIDSSDNLYVTETGNRSIRKISPVGDVTTNPSHFSFPESYNGAYGAITVDPAGNLYFSWYLFTNTYSHAPDSRDYYTRHIGYVYKMSPNGLNTSLWETSFWNYADGRQSNNGVFDLHADSVGRFLYFSNHQIKRYPGFSVLAGTGSVGSIDGSKSVARFSSSARLTQDSNGVIYVADTGNNNIRKVNPDGSVATFAGLALERATGNLDGLGSAALFTQPTGSAVDHAGNIYISDSALHCIRKINPQGLVTTFAGSPGQAGSSDGTGTAARFNRPASIDIDQTGNLFVADSFNHTIRRISPIGVTTTYAGQPGVAGSDDGAKGAALFTYPQGVAVNQTGNVYVAAGSAIRRISTDGQTSTYAGSKSKSGNAEGYRTSARFNNLRGLTIDDAGNLYLSDSTSGTSRIRKITIAGYVSTVAGAETGYNDGNVTDARFNLPSDLVVAENGDLFVADSYNHVIRKITAAGAVRTIAGLGDAPGDMEGSGRDSRFYYPSSITIDQTGQLYVTSGTTVKKGQLSTLPVITTQPVNRSVSSGSSIQLSISATGNPAPTYQWQYNGEPINGATKSTLSFTNARMSDAGNYTVVVTNELGSVTSNVAKLTVTAASAPSIPSGSSSGGGGGAPSIHFLLSLFATTLIKYCLRTRD